MPYPYSVEFPELVTRAHAQAEMLGFPLLPQGRPIGVPAPTTAITPTDGALLRFLAASRPSGLIGEIGTGPGVSASWILSGMGEEARLMTVELDERLAKHAVEFFGGYPHVQVRQGDWQSQIGLTTQFDLLFFDANAHEVLGHAENWRRVANMVAVGGLLMMDDLAPVEYWPEEWKGGRDHKREFCLCNPQFAGAEVRTSARTACLVATRLS